MKKQSHQTLVHPDDIEKIRTFHEKRLLGEDVLDRYELKSIQKDGTVINVEVVISNIVVEGDKIVGTRNYMWKKS